MGQAEPLNSHYLPQGKGMEQVFSYRQCPFLLLLQSRRSMALRAKVVLF